MNHRALPFVDRDHMDPIAAYLVRHYGPPKALRSLVHVAPGVFVTDPLPTTQIHRTPDGWAVVGCQTHFAPTLDRANQLASET